MVSLKQHAYVLLVVEIEAYRTFLCFYVDSYDKIFLYDHAKDWPILGSFSDRLEMA